VGRSDFHSRKGGDPELEERDDLRDPTLRGRSREGEPRGGGRDPGRESRSDRDRGARPKRGSGHVFAARGREGGVAILKRKKKKHEGLERTHASNSAWKKRGKLRLPKKGSSSQETTGPPTGLGEARRRRGPREQGGGHLPTRK